MSEKTREINGIFSVVRENGEKKWFLLDAKGIMFSLRRLSTHIYRTQHFFPIAEGPIPFLS